MINTNIGKYKITRLIGEGGMASVYEADHEMLGTKVAIKVLNPILSANAQIKERFRNEAKLMALLDHPNITKVIDFDEQPQQLSIVMEYLNGEDLSQKIKRNGPLSEKEITNIFSQTLSAFQYAHEKGIVHRDIKPSNIFILPNGHVKILDFGIAKLFGQGNEITQTGTQMGTVVYMSPEQVKSDKSIDYRSDIYSLGVTLFFCVNGKTPYQSDTDSQYEIFSKIIQEALPEISGNSQLNRMLKKACQKNREDRYQSCREWLSDLNHLDTKKKYQSDPTREVISQTSFSPNYLTDKQKTTGPIIFIVSGIGLILAIIIFVLINSNSSEKVNDNSNLDLESSSTATGEGDINSADSATTVIVEADPSAVITNEHKPISREEVKNAYNTYLKAWNNKDYDIQASYLSEDFIYIDDKEMKSKSEYLKNKKRLFDKYPWINIYASNENININDYFGVVSYFQHYDSPNYESWGTNTFYFKKINDRIFLYKEKFEPTEKRAKTNGDGSY
jgi:serine/threonine protein kinase